MLPDNEDTFAKGDLHLERANKHRRTPHSPVGGLLNIVPQLVVILLTIVHFWRLDRGAALCLVPLAGWVGFASLLNYAIWQLND